MYCDIYRELLNKELCCCFSLSATGPVISWKSNNPQLALAATAQESPFLVQLSSKTDNECIYTPVTIFEDNRGATALSKNPLCHQRCEHVDVKYTFVRSALLEGKMT